MEREESTSAAANLKDKEKNESEDENEEKEDVEEEEEKDVVKISKEGSSKKDNAYELYAQDRSFQKEGQVFKNDVEVSLYYELYGKGKQNVLFITGFLATLRMWDVTTSYLLKNHPEFTICLVDNETAGKSWIAGSQPNLSTSSMASNLFKLLTHLGWSSVHVIGASMGGMIAQELAWLLVDEKSTIQMKSLFLAVTSAGSFWRAPFGSGTYGRMYSVMGLLNKPKEEMVQQVLESGYSKQFLDSTDAVTGEKMKEKVKKEIEADWDEHLCWKIETISAQARASQTHYMAKKRLQKIKNSRVPITVQISTQDNLVGPRQQWSLARKLEANTLVLKGAGHVGAREQWDLWTAGLISHLLEASKSST